jgi:hypothetical protein
MRREYAAKLVLTCLFLGLFAIFLLTQQVKDVKLSALDLILLGLATFRLGNLVAYDHVFEPLRAPFAVTVPDGTGAGDSVEARGTGVQRALGQLVSCPICSGTWIAAFLVYGLALFSGPTRLFLWMAAAVGLAQVIGATVEALSWSGAYSRARTGAITITNRRQQQEEAPLQQDAPIQKSLPYRDPSVIVVSPDCPEEETFHPASKTPGGWMKHEIHQTSEDQGSEK